MILLKKTSTFILHYALSIFIANLAVGILSLIFCVNITLVTDRQSGDTFSLLMAFLIVN